MSGKIALLFISIRLALSVEEYTTKAFVDLEQAEDGEKFIKKILDGTGTSDRPKELMFTAPFKLCDGGRNCSSNNFAMIFPLYVGKRAEEKYKQLYTRDYNKISNGKFNAPFKRKTATRIFTPCPVYYRITTLSTSPPTAYTTPQSHKIRGNPVKEPEKLHENGFFENRNPSVPICYPKFNPYWCYCE